jgi:hypothetical protein
MQFDMCDVMWSGDCVLDWSHTHWDVLYFWAEYIKLDIYKTRSQGVKRQEKDPADNIQLNKREYALGFTLNSKIKALLFKVKSSLCSGIRS